MLKLWEQRIKQDIKQNISAAFFLLFYTALFIFFGWLLIEQFIDNLIVIDIIVNLLWMLVSICQIVINWRKLIQIEVEPEPQIDNSNRNKSLLVTEQERSFMGFTRQDLSATVAIFILSIPIIVIAILLFSGEASNSYSTSDPNYQTFSSYSNILFAIALIFKDLRELFNIEQQRLNKILDLLIIILMLGGGVLLFLSIDYLIN